MQPSITLPITKFINFFQQKLEDEINHRCNLSPINFNDVSFPFLAIVRSQEFSKLFRAFVLSGTNEKQCDVFYCDWGNKEIVSAKNIFKAPAEFCQQPAAAIRMTLTNEKNEFTEWTAASAQYFMNLVNKGLSLKVKVRVSLCVKSCAPLISLDLRNLMYLRI